LVVIASINSTFSTQKHFSSRHKVKLSSTSGSSGFSGVVEFSSGFSGVVELSSGLTGVVELSSGLTGIGL